MLLTHQGQLIGGQLNINNKNKMFIIIDEDYNVLIRNCQDEETANKTAENLSKKLDVKTIVLKDINKFGLKPITERVVNYATACVVLGVKWVADEVFKMNSFSIDEIAFYKLKVIAKALNEKWSPNLDNKNEKIYWPEFIYDGKTNRFCFNRVLNNFDHDITAPIKLCFKNYKLAKYAGNQFEDMYNDFLLNNQWHT